MATCKDCVHWRACKAMLEVMGYSVSGDFAGSAERCDTFVPTADLVEVVRCKDCQYCKIHYPFKIINEEAKKVYSCNVHWHGVRPDGYCDLGERRE